MKIKIALISMLFVLASASVHAASKAPAAGGERSDFALFDGTGGDTGAQCGAKLGSSGQAVAFTYHVTVANINAEVRFLKVVYADGDFVRYPIPPNSSFSFSQAAGGTAGVDDRIRVFSETASPAGLVGSMSASFPAAAKPHPSVSATDFCTTLTTPAP